MLYEGRSDLLTVTGASTVNGHGELRSDGPALQAAGRACDTLLRLFDTGEANQPAYNLLVRYLGLLDADPGDGERSRRGARLPDEAGARGRLLARARELCALR